MAGLHQGGGMRSLLQQLTQAADKLDVSKVPCLLEEGLDKEGWAGVVDDLQKITLNYCPNNEHRSSSDSE